MAVVGWVAAGQRMPVTLRDPSRPEASRIRIGEAAPVWLLGDGWMWAGGAFRWTRPRATAELHRPAGARFFEVALYVSPLQLKDQGSVTVEPVVDGEPLGVKRFTREGWHTERWPVRAGDEKMVAIELRFPAPYRPAGHEGEPFGATVGGFGFAE